MRALLQRPFSGGEVVTYARKTAEDIVRQFAEWVVIDREDLRERLANHAEWYVAQVIEHCAVAARTDIHYEEDAVNEAIGRIRELATTEVEP